MKKIGIFYGTTTGNTREVAIEIANRLGVDLADVRDVSASAPSDVAPYDVLLLGASTWGPGDLQADMATFTDGLCVLDLSSKMVALFGCGSTAHKNTFCNAVGEMYHKLHDTHAEFFGHFNNDGYTYEHSRADFEGLVLGLCIDNANHADMTPKRIADWCKIIEAETTDHPVGI